ncbi:cilia- and flagella-associated protein 45 [Ornithorhynchus anatinus]|uniref:Cilia- and flagella-associated protein 45 n=2 Tax=Ornithorhynchus anatinus TaxID=9258 RepID=F6RSL2_ORNAN|nr:cilia- and flagella-associated protein 45 [Ornithorhynchus anatinus]
MVTGQQIRAAETMSRMSGAPSSGSSASSGSKTRTRYRTKAVSSEVDETLFGGAEPIPRSRARSPIVLLKDQRTTRKTTSALGWGHKQDKIRLITRDLIRDLVVPVEDPSGESLIISPEDFQRIQSSARVLTKEEKEAGFQAYKAEKDKILVGMAQRKQAMKQNDVRRRKNERLSDLEEAARKQAHNLLERARKLHLDQEDELKEMNKIILNAKCHAIRDAQILEKQQIGKEMDAEEKRLDQMMEVERQKAMQRQDDLDRRKKEEQIRGQRLIVEQIEKNSEERSLQNEQREQETQRVLRYLDQLQEEDMRDLERRRVEQVRIQTEIMHCNEANRQRQEEIREQERLADQRALEYTQKKMAREIEFEAEQARIRKEKEMETARLLALQEKAQDTQAEQDAVRARHIQEMAERAWRQKEVEEAKRKVEANAQLQRSRLEQVAHKEHALAVQVQRDRDEFERVLGAQRLQIEKERKEAEQRAALRRAHAEELRHQVREHQQQQVQERTATFEEGRRLQEEAAQRRERMNALKRKKLEELRAAGLPEKYCVEVERKAITLPSLLR